MYASIIRFVLILLYLYACGSGVAYKCVPVYVASMPNDDTSIRIKVDTWQRLNARKDKPNQSFDDVINDLLDQVEAIEEDTEGNPKPAMATSD